MIKNISLSMKSFSLNLFVLFFIVIIMIFSHTKEVFSLPINIFLNSQPQIIEYLKIHVPSDQLDEWIESEKSSWEPWLMTQKGFLGRQLLWDKDSDEAILLISWETRAKWKSIPQSEIKSVQMRFEEIARAKTGIKEGNPFPLTYEGELMPQ